MVLPYILFRHDHNAKCKMKDAKCKSQMKCDIRDIRVDFYNKLSSSIQWLPLPRTSSLSSFSLPNPEWTNMGEGGKGGGRGGGGDLGRERPRGRSG